MNNILGILGSFALVFIVLGVAGLLLRTGLVSPGISRKVVHIGVSNWWLFAMAAIDALWAAAIGPVVFILFNSFSYARSLIPAMDIGAPKENLGTIYFPISLLTAVLLCYGGLFPLHAGAVGILVMGYGDGGAALFGTRFGRRSLRIFGFQHTKTLAGSAAMLLISSSVTAAVAFFAQPEMRFPALLLIAVLTGLFAAGVELFTPRGIDNLTVPILTTIFYGSMWI